MTYVTHGNCVIFIAVVLTTVDGECDGGWLSNFGNEYCVDPEQETYADARSICQNRNSELASITSDAECDYIADLMSVTFCNSNHVIITTSPRST